MSLWGPGTEAFLVDVGGRGLVNVTTTMPEEGSPDAPARERLAAVAEVVGWRLPALVDSLDEGADVFFDRIREVSAERWHRGRVAIAGDAAHAVHPISGMGAALALEDAYVLADELAAAESISGAFTDFEARRRKRVAAVKRTARFEEATAFAESPLATGLRDALIRRTPIFEWFLRRQVDDLTTAPLADL